MLKKILLVVLSLLSTVCWSWKPGFYAGAGLGIDTTNYQNRSFVQRQLDFNVINKTSHAAQGLLGTIFAGYGWNHSVFYLGGEVNGNASTAQSNSSNHELIHRTLAKTTFKINRSWGLSVLPGLILPENTLIYARVGYARGSLDVNTSDNSLANTNTMLHGLRTGVGIEKMIYRNFALRFEYSHIRYQELNSLVVEPFGSVIKRSITTPLTNQFELDVNYRFC